MLIPIILSYVDSHHFTPCVVSGTENKSGQKLNSFRNEALLCDKKYNKMIKVKTSLLLTDPGDVNVTDNQLTIHGKLSLYHDLYRGHSK